MHGKGIRWGVPIQLPASLIAARPWRHRAPEHQKQQEDNQPALELEIHVAPAGGRLYDLVPVRAVPVLAPYRTKSSDEWSSRRLGTLSSAGNEW